MDKLPRLCTLIETGIASNRFPAAALYEKALALHPRNVEGCVGLRDAGRFTGNSKRLERAESMLKVLKFSETD